MSWTVHNGQCRNLPSVNVTPPTARASLFVFHVLWGGSVLVFDSWGHIREREFFSARGNHAACRPFSRLCPSGPTLRGIPWGCPSRSRRPEPAKKVRKAIPAAARAQRAADRESGMTHGVQNDVTLFLFHQGAKVTAWTDHRFLTSLMRWGILKPISGSLRSRAALKMLLYLMQSKSYGVKRLEINVFFCALRRGCMAQSTRGVDSR